MAGLSSFLQILPELFGFLTAFGIPPRISARRAQCIYENLPAEVVNQVLRAIEHVATGVPSITLLRPSEEIGHDEAVLLESHIGGLPYAEANDKWPQGTNGDPATLLLQVRMDEPSLGEQWQGRLFVVFLAPDLKLIVRSYANPSAEKYIPLESGSRRRVCNRLSQHRMPTESDDELLPMSASKLVETVLEIKKLLQPYTRDCSAVLSQVLQPGFNGHDLEAEHAIYLGGEPLVIQQPHEPLCDHCGTPMRFLLQFGNVFPGVQMPKGSVASVYGCDDHPNQCRGVLDTY